MKIIYFSPHPHVNMSAPSGPGTHIREVIKGFEQRGHQVVRFIAGGEVLKHTGNEISFKKRNWKKWIPSILWETLKDYRLKSLDKQLEKNLIELIEKEKPDFVYERAYYLMGAGYRACIKTKTRYCCEINAPYPEEKKEMNGKSFFQSSAERNERLQIEAAHRVFVVSTALKNYLLGKASIASDKIQVTPNAVNPKNIRINAQHKNALLQKLNIHSSDIVLGFVGSIFPYHGVDLLIESFAHLKKENKSPLKLLVVGDGEILSQLKSRTHVLGISDHVIFTGNVPHAEVYTYIDIMNITIMARSNWYGSPVKIFEYGALQKKIIAPQVIPVQDVMTNLEDGLLISDNIDELTFAILYMLNNPTKAEVMAACFHQKVMTRYTWQQVSDSILQYSA